MKAARETEVTHQFLIELPLSIIAKPKVNKGNVERAGSRVFTLL